MRGARPWSGVGWAIVVLTIGCRRLPETVPYQASFINKSDKDGVYRLGEVVGTEITLDGHAVAKLAKTGTLRNDVTAKWSGPKAEVRANVNGRYGLSLLGPCGPFSLGAEGPSEIVKGKSDRELAKSIESEGFLKLIFRIDLPARYVVYVDRGAVGGTLRIGPTVVESGKTTVPFFLGGCGKGPNVTLDGVNLGSLDLSANGALVSLDPNVCHVIADVTYGRGAAARPNRSLSAKAVVGLPESPDYVFERAPSTVTTTATGTTLTELVRVPCR